MQVILVAIVIGFPQTVTVFLDKPLVVDLDKVQMPDAGKKENKDDQQAMDELFKSSGPAASSPK
jgi:hypothetical protein